MARLALIDEYFSTARERYRIMLRRDSGLPAPWTNDPVFKNWRFCNVRREDDATTRWFRDNVRSRLSGLDVARATLAFRWFNRIETGEKIKSFLLNGWDSRGVKKALRDVRPVVSGAFVISSPPGMSKLDGIVWCVENGIKSLDRFYFAWENGTSLEHAWEDLQFITGLGPFMAYEIVTDLRHTNVLCEAPDIMTWANPGPGCKRGISRVIDKNPDSCRDIEKLLGLMREILDMSKSETFWPTGWPAWEMREVEHWACEFDKYRRGFNGEKLKRRFRG